MSKVRQRSDTASTPRGYILSAAQCVGYSLESPIGVNSRVSRASAPRNSSFGFRHSHRPFYPRNLSRRSLGVGGSAVSSKKSKTFRVTSRHISSSTSVKARQAPKNKKPKKAKTRKGNWRLNYEQTKN